MYSFLPLFINDECLLSLFKFVYLLVKYNQEYLQKEKKVMGCLDWNSCCLCCRYIKKLWVSQLIRLCLKS